ncbi:hypothetical protein CCHL11_03875 [Colletotrichum chlorophyti]|uniref:Rhodopsin domain-containing protein n=1 Tax=Colletotrichum chlorophyti TaxID=708187 RepID=A0A1Q8RQS9_9PEZI|nr:hypothetical protein CCHL11_03875 [Colletotrichum chlorophyti]
MSANTNTDPTAQAAAAAARQFTIEAWTLYAIGVLTTILRTYARAKAVGVRNFRADDYLIWLAILFYTVQSALAHSVGSFAHGLANNGMTDDERVALSLTDPEYQLRIIGSKIQIAGWTTYSTLMVLLKLAMLVFYLRLTAAVSLPIIWTSFAANISTDIYLILIPIPLLWESTLRLTKKIASTIILGAGIFVLVCATLKSVFVLVDPEDGAQLAGTWGTRETFVAVVTTNLPMIFPLIRVWLKPIWPSTLRSSRKVYQTPTGFRTIGGGGGGDSRRTGPPSANPITANMTFTESEERIMNDVKMYNIKGSSAAKDEKSPQGIMVSSEVEVTTEDSTSQLTEHRRQRAHEGW